MDFFSGLKSTRRFSSFKVLFKSKISLSPSLVLQRTQLILLFCEFLGHLFKSLLVSPYPSMNLVIQRFVLPPVYPNTSFLPKEMMNL